MFQRVKKQEYNLNSKLKKTQDMRVLSNQEANLRSGREKLKEEEELEDTGKVFHMNQNKFQIE